MPVRGHAQELLVETDSTYSSSEGIHLSLVIPVLDEAATLPELLAGIASQTRRPDEVVFVDGGSRDNSAAILRAASETDLTLRLMEAGEATPGRGRNIGIAAASHEWTA